MPMVNGKKYAYTKKGNALQAHDVACLVQADNKG